MEYNRELGSNFWFEFDNAFLFRPSIEVRRIYGVLRGPDFIRTRWIDSRIAGTYPDSFIQDILPMREALVRLSELQWEIFNRFFEGDMERIRLAFEDFGQGVLYDDRRNPGDKIHKMDVGGPLSPPIGYHRWHPIIRASVISGSDPDLWLQINRFVGLAWAIQSVAKPLEDNPENQTLEEETLNSLRHNWLGMDAYQLDNAFDNYPYPAGVL